MHSSEDLRKELAANGAKSAFRFIAYHKNIGPDQVKSFIAHELCISRAVISRWQLAGIDEQYIPHILKILNSIRPVWARYQLAPRMREVEIWKRVAMNGRFRD